MPYTQATVLELLRFSSIVPLGIPHTAMCDTTVKGYTIPAGTEVMANLWELHHDEKFWDKPFEFCPERYLDPSGDLVDASHENRRHTMPFGAGPRVCVGEVLARTRLFMFIATTAQMFEIKLAGSADVSCDPRDYEHGGVLSPKDYEIQAVCRNNTLFL